MMNENDKKVPLIVVAFTKNGVCETHLVFSREENGKSLGKKVHFFGPLGATKISTVFRLSVYIHVVLLINFPEQFELCFYFNPKWYGV